MSDARKIAAGLIPMLQKTLIAIEDGKINYAREACIKAEIKEWRSWRVLFSYLESKGLVKCIDYTFMYSGACYITLLGLAVKKELAPASAKAMAGRKDEG